MTFLLWLGLGAAIMQLICIDHPSAAGRWTALQMIVLWFYFITK
jgi:hypothetical protein